MSNPNEGQWNGQTGQPNQSQPSQPNQSQPSQPNPAGRPGQPQYGAYDSNHGGQYPPQGAPGAQDTQNQQAQNGQPQADRTRTRTTARTPTIRTMARTPPAWGPDGRPGNQNQSGWQQTSWVAGNFNPFRLMEEFLPEKAKTKIRVSMACRVAAIAWVPPCAGAEQDASLAALLLGVYFVISGWCASSALSGVGSAGRLACAGVFVVFC
nr:hypothetical protein [Bifidobacterium longum]